MKDFSMPQGHSKFNFYKHLFINLLEDFFTVFSLLASFFSWILLFYPQSLILGFSLHFALIFFVLTSFWVYEGPLLFKDQIKTRLFSQLKTKLLPQMQPHLYRRMQMLKGFCLSLLVFVLILVFVFLSNIYALANALLLVGLYFLGEPLSRFKFSIFLFLNFFFSWGLWGWVGYPLGVLFFVQVFFLLYLRHEKLFFQQFFFFVLVLSSFMWFAELHFFVFLVSIGAYLTTILVFALRKEKFKMNFESLNSFIKVPMNQRFTVWFLIFWNLFFSISCMLA